MDMSVMLNLLWPGCPVWGRFGSSHPQPLPFLIIAQQELPNKKSMAKTRATRYKAAATNTKGVGKILNPRTSIIKMEATNPKLENNHISIRFIRFPFPFSSVERPNEHWAENIRYMSHPEVLGSPSSIFRLAF